MKGIKISKKHKEARDCYNQLHKKDMCYLPKLQEIIGEKYKKEWTLIYKMFCAYEMEIDRLQKIINK